MMIILTNQVNTMVDLRNIWETHATYVLV